jgi:hypothetical protein
MNTKRVLIGVLLLGLAVLTGAGCGHDENAPSLTAPSMPGPDGTPLGLGRPGLQIDRLVSETPGDQIVTTMIGPEGGKIQIENLWVEFPSGCLTEKTAITLRVRTGQEVLFQIAPVDLKLMCPVRLNFKLRPGDDPKVLTFLRYDETLHVLDSTVVGSTLVSESDRLGDFLIGPKSLDGSKGRAGW